MIENLINKYAKEQGITPIDYSKLPAIDIDSQNLYAVMTSEVAPRMNALFVFDYLHFGIRVYYKNELDIDTGIFIGFRNLANSINIDVDSDSIYTRFTVQGDNGLEFRDINYGDNTIINLDYFLGEPYMEETITHSKGLKSTADKYREWVEFRREHIDEYTELAKRYNTLSEAINELTYRVPSDASYWKNWDSMREDGLNKNLEYYNEFL